jgi:hypothetical protein
MLKHIRATIDTGAFAIPNAEHAIVLIAARRRKAELLCAPNRGGGQLFVYSWLEDDMLVLQKFFGFPQRLVIPRLAASHDSR